MPTEAHLGRNGQPGDILFGSSLLTTKQLAEALAISEKTVYAYVAKGIIPFIKIESNVRFRPHAIREWLRRKEYLPSELQRN
jgi:excisionase family DNA binding protein